MLKRVSTINIFVIMIVVFYTIFTQQVLAAAQLGKVWANCLLFVSSVGAYRLLISFMYWATANSNLLLRLYWGRQYISGIWTYFYTKEDGTDGERRIYFGVWKFEQDLFRTKVVGFGLSDTFTIRSRVDSVTDMFEKHNHYDILNARWDVVNPEKGVFSLTSMLFNDYKRFGLLKHATVIRANTTIYGGKLNGDIHNDILTKHPEFETENQAIEYLKTEVKRLAASRPTQATPFPKEGNRGSIENKVVESITQKIT